jgi:hypothetical protein
MINDDELILYFYRDGLSAARCSEIAECLNSDAALSARYCALVAELDHLGHAPDVPVPELTQARWRAPFAPVCCAQWANTVDVADVGAGCGDPDARHCDRCADARRSPR